MASEDDLLKDDDIQKLLAQAQGLSPPPAAAPKPSAPAPTPAAAGGDNLIGANELEALLAGAGAPPPPAAVSAPPKPKPAASSAAKSSSSTSKRASQLLDRVESGIDAVMNEGRRGRSNLANDTSAAQPFQLQEFSGGGGHGRGFSLGTLDDVELDLHIELGRAELMIDEVLNLNEGAVVSLDKMAGDPVDVVVNGRLIARGEVLVLNDNFCVRIAEIVTPDF